MKGFFYQDVVATGSWQHIKFDMQTKHIRLRMIVDGTLYFRWECEGDEAHGVLDANSKLEQFDEFTATKVLIKGTGTVRIYAW